MRFSAQQKEYVFWFSVDNKKLFSLMWAHSTGNRSANQFLVIKRCKHFLKKSKHFQKSWNHLQKPKHFQNKPEHSKKTLNIPKQLCNFMSATAKHFRGAIEKGNVCERHVGRMRGWGNAVQRVVVQTTYEYPMSWQAWQDKTHSGWNQRTHWRVRKMRDSS